LGGVEARKAERLWICERKRKVRIYPSRHRELRGSWGAHPSAKEIEEETLLERILDETERKTSFPDESYRVLWIESCDLIGGLEDHAVSRSRMSEA